MDHLLSREKYSQREGKGKGKTSPCGLISEVLFGFERPIGSLRNKKVFEKWIILQAKLRK